jgi:hypothetical protein
MSKILKFSNFVNESNPEWGKPQNDTMEGLKLTQEYLQSKGLDQKVIKQLTGFIFGQLEEMRPPRLVGNKAIKFVQDLKDKKYPGMDYDSWIKLEY